MWCLLACSSHAKPFQLPGKHRRCGERAQACRAYRVVILAGRCTRLSKCKHTALLSVCKRAAGAPLRSGSTGGGTWRRAARARPARAASPHPRQRRQSAQTAPPPAAAPIWAQQAAAARPAPRRPARRRPHLRPRGPARDDGQRGAAVRVHARTRAHARLAFLQSCLRHHAPRALAAHAATLWRLRRQLAAPVCAEHGCMLAACNPPRRRGSSVPAWPWRGGGERGVACLRPSLLRTEPCLGARRVAERPALPAVELREGTAAAGPHRAALRRTCGSRSRSRAAPPARAPPRRPPWRSRTPPG